MNWSTLFYDQAIETVDFPQPTSGFAVGWAGRILNRTDSGLTWIDQTSGTSVNLNDVSFAGNALTGVVVGDSRHDSSHIKWWSVIAKPTPTPTATPTATPPPTATPRPTLTPRSRPTPAPRP